MAKQEYKLAGDFDELLEILEREITGDSVSATLEAASDFRGNGARCSVRVFERFDWMGDARVSLTCTLFCGAPGQPICLSVIAAGGSRAWVHKIRTHGKESFLKDVQALFCPPEQDGR